MLGIIVLHYNTINKTIDCINSIKKETHEPYHIYIIDNASPNATGSILKRKYAYDLNITVILNDSNEGFARANNKALNMAINDGCNIAILSNNDIIIKNNAIDKLCISIKENPNAVIIAPRILNNKGCIQNSIKRLRMTVKQYILCETVLNLLFKRKNSISIESIQKVYWVSGCFFAVNLDNFRRINLFDEETFLFYEEYILSEKSRKHNFDILYNPNSEVIHHHGASVGKLNIFAYKERYRSECYFLNKYMINDFGRNNIKLIKCLRIFEVVLLFGLRHNKWNDVKEFYTFVKEC
ncbi:glycosyltransferase [Clostridium perfringens]